MKRLFFTLVLALALMFPVFALSETAELELTLRDRTNLQEDVTYYRLYYDTNTLVGVVDFTGIKYYDLLMADLSSGVTDPQTQDYIETINIDSPDGVVTTWYFGAVTVDKMDRVSSLSNEVAAVIDFKDPAAPEIIDLILKVGNRKVRIIIK